MPGSKESIQFNRFEIYSNENSANIADIRSGTPRIEYRESVFMPYVLITAAVVDTGYGFDADDGSGRTIGLLEAIKCQGTENVIFEIEDEVGNKISLKDLKVATTSHISQSFKNTSFILSAVSKEAFDNTLLENRCRRAYGGKISDVAQTIIQQDLKSNKTIDFDETLDEFYESGQDRYPFELLLDLQKLAIPNIPSADGKMAGYLFWQTSKGFHFKSLDKLFDKTGKTIKKYIENKKVDRIIPAGYDDKILYSKISRSTNALGQFESGAYGTVLEVWDEINKIYQKLEPFTAEESGNGIIAGKYLPRVNPEYSGKATVRIKTQKAKGQTVVPGDSLEKQVEKQEKENYPTEKIIQQAQQNYRQKFNMSAEIVIPSDLSLHAGDLIYCEFPELSTKKTLIGSPKDSGLYMIADLCHFGNKTTAFTGLHLVRDSYGVK